jgi:type II secretion system (T2SS) protein E
MASMSELSFPALDSFELDPWQWPAPPFAKWPRTEAEDQGPLPCQLETVSGDALEGLAESFDPRVESLQFRATGGSSRQALPFTRIKRLLVTRPARLLDGDTREPYTQVPAAAQERDYRLERPPPQATAVGRTLGHVETEHGLFLFPAADDGSGVQRAFFPRASYQRCSFGESIAETAAKQWIHTPAALSAAVATQGRQAVMPMGKALVEMGLATPAQVERALAASLGDKPLGERLIALGMLARADLDTAIAYKMGFPVVDLMRFPLEANALKALSLQSAMACRAVPLMFDGLKLVVAADKPGRLDELRERQALHHPALAVIATPAHVKFALGGMSQRLNVWGSSRTSHAGAFG